MTEPITITDLDQLTDITVSVTIPLPDGRQAVVKLRPLSAKEVRAIRRSIVWPKAPIVDYKKDGNTAAPVYDYQSKEYKDATEEADALLARKMLVASLVINIPGENEEQKCAALEDKLGQFAFTFLLNAVNRINIPQTEDINSMLESFRPVGTVGASGNGKARPRAA